MAIPFSTRGRQAWTYLGETNHYREEARGGSSDIRDKHSSITTHQLDFISKQTTITLARKERLPYTTHTSHEVKVLSYFMPVKSAQHNLRTCSSVLTGPHIPSLRIMLSSQYSLFLIAPLNIQKPFSWTSHYSS